mgnify:FL=1
MRTLGARLRWAREKSGISARRLDELAGLSPGHTSAIESERRLDPSTSTVAALARALGISLDWLVDGTGTAPSERKLRRTSTDS